MTTESENPVVRVLGRFRVGGSQPTHMSSEGRRVAAVLTLCAGEWVGIAELAQELQLPDATSLQSRATVQRMVQEVRSCRKLSVEAVGAGYTLNLEKNAVDFHRLVQFLSQTRCQLERNRLADAEDALAAARSLTDGAFLEDVEQGATLEPWARMFDDYLRMAKLIHFELALRRGRHQGVIEGLFFEWRKQKEHEDIASLLLLALFRSRRRAEVDSVYEATCEALRNRHKLDPGPQLELLYQQIREGNKQLLEWQEPTGVITS